MNMIKLHIKKLKKKKAPIIIMELQSLSLF